MHVSRCGRRTAVAAAVLLGCCGLTAPAHAGFASQLFAGPHGSDAAACTKLDPCSLHTAFADAVSGSEIIIMPGSYGSQGTPLTETFTDYSKAELIISGQDGKPAPVIYTGKDTGFLIYNSSVSHLDLVSTATDGAFWMHSGEADHIVVVDSAPSTYACGIFSIITDSLCLETGDDAAAIDTSSSGDAESTITGVTAIATGAGGEGLDVGSNGGTVTATVKNTILRGTADDVITNADPGSSSIVNLRNSDYRFGHVANAGTGAGSIANQGGSIAKAPVFVDPGSGNYREKPTSPTIDKGASVPGGDTDLAGSPRILGKAPDIGAFEFLPRPHVGTLHLIHKTSHALKVRLGVNPEGLATVVRLTGRHGQHHLASRRVPAGSGRTNRSVTLRLHGLHPGQKYRLLATASSSGGRARSAKQTVRIPRH